MPKIEAVKLIIHNQKPYKPGLVFDVDDDAAEELIAVGAARAAAPAKQAAKGADKGDGK